MMTATIAADAVSAPRVSERRSRVASGEVSGPSQPAGISVSSGQRRLARATMMLRQTTVEPVG